MSDVLILGAGMVSRPLVRYLLDHCSGGKVKVASRTVAKAEALVNGHPLGEAMELDVAHEKKLEDLIAGTNFVISLLPYIHHVKVAVLCVKHGKNMVTTSYVSPEMKELDEDAKKKGIILLNECGLDPGIDHMSAMRIIHDVEGRQGTITDFSSCCGALPAHQSNTNPMGYKFSWAPRGVILAGKNPARFLKDGVVVKVPGPSLFDGYEFKTVPGVGVFENYPNRDSLPYRDIYGINDSKSVYRGTLRYPGWCETLKAIVELGYMDETIRADIGGKTYAQVIRGLVQGEGDIVEEIASFLGLGINSAVIKRLKWLGLASDEQIPIKAKSFLDVLASRMLDMMPMEKGDVDMCVLFHEFTAEFPDGHREYITSTLIDYGHPKGDTAIARTVALPAAIGARMILNGQISLTGVRIPVEPGIYGPILQELEMTGIKCVERIEVQEMIMNSRT